MAKKTKKSADDADVSVKSLDKSIRQLTRGLDTLQSSFQTFAAGNMDFAKQVAGLAINAQDAKKEYKTLTDLSEWAAKNSDKLVDSSDQFNSLLQRTIELESAILAVQNDQTTKTVKSLVDKQTISERYGKLQGLERQIQKEINDYQEKLNTLQGEERDNVSSLIKLAQEKLQRVEEAKKIEESLVNDLKAQTHELEKQKIIQSSINGIGDKFKGILGESGEELIELGKGLKESMVSPMALIGALLGNTLEEFNRITKTSREFLNTTGLTVDKTEHLRHEAHELALEMRDQGVQMKDVFDAQAALLNQYGSINRVSDETTKKVVQLGKAFGIAAESSAGVIYNIQKATGVSAEVAGNVAALGANFAKAAGVAPNEVFKDIANSSEQIAQYFKGTPADLMRTAVEARRLGLNIAKVADISKALLSFESSIEDQMTASVLLGREINLDKARQLAMEGKIQEAAEETLKQVGSLADFNKMNAVQKEAIAKAAGMTVGDLQQSLEKQEAIKNMSAAQRAEYEKGLVALKGQNMSAAEKLLRDQKNQLTQEKIADAVAKISDIFANVILPVLEPIFDALSGVARVIGWMGPGIMFVLRALLLVKVATLAFQGIVKLISFKRANAELGVMKTLMTNISSFGSKIWSGLMNITGITSAKKALESLKAAKAADTVVTTVNSNAQKLNAIQTAYYKQLRLAGVPATMAMAQARAFDTTQTEANTGASVTNTAAQSKLGKVVQSILGFFKLSKTAKAADTAITELNTGANVTNAAAQSGIGKVISSIGKFFGISRAAKAADTIATNLNTTAQAASIAPTTAAGTAAGFSATGFLALGAALLMVGGGIYLAATGMAELVKSFKGLEPEEILGAVAAITALGVGFYFLIPALGAVAAAATVGAVGLLALGASVMMIGAGIGIAAAGFSLLVTSVASASDELIKLIKNVEVTQLLAIAGGLTAIGLALSSIATFGLLALPALGAIAAISLGAGMAASSMGGDTGDVGFGGGQSGGGGAGGSWEEEESGKQLELLQSIADKLDALTTAITSAGEIKLDAKKVGEVLAINTVRNYKISS